MGGKVSQFINEWSEWWQSFKFNNEWSDIKKFVKYV